MDSRKKKQLTQAAMILVAAGLNIWGILTLLQTLGADVGLSYIDSIPNLVVKYVVVVATMACGIMLMSAAAGTFAGKVKNVFSIAVCAYSTIMTIPLFLAFILMIPVAAALRCPLSSTRWCAISSSRSNHSSARAECSILFTRWAS